MLKEKRYAFPPVKPELASEFFAILIGFTLEAAEATAYDPQGALPPIFAAVACTQPYVRCSRCCQDPDAWHVVTTSSMLLLQETGLIMAADSPLL